MSDLEVSAADGVLTLRLNRPALDLVSSHFAVVASTDDAAEALTAFREKRPAVFQGK